MVSPYIYPMGGGLGHHVYYLSLSLSRLGCEMQILSTRGYQELVKIQGIDNKTRLRLFTVFNSPIAPDLFASIPRIDADIIHAHGYFHYSTIWASLVSASQRRPIVITTHGSWVSSSRKRGLQHIYDKCATRLFFSRTHKILAHTFFEKQRLENAGFPSGKIEVIYNGVDCEKFNPKVQGKLFRARFNLPSSASIVLFVGRLTERKGCHNLVRALVGILEEVPGTLLFVAGSGPELPRLKNLVSKLNLTENVFFLGEVSKDELPLVYAASDVIVLPSISGEGLPLVLLEAMASAKSMVATAVGGIPEIFSMTDYGVLIPPNNIKKLTEAIIQQLTNKSLRESLGKKGRQWVERKLCWGTVARRVYEIYEGILKC